VVDLALAVVVLAATASVDRHATRSDTATVWIPGSLLAGIFTTSAVVGFSSTATCDTDSERVAPANACIAALRALEITAPRLSVPWLAARNQLGPPDVRLAYRSNGDTWAEAQWVYATRGLSFIAPEDEATRAFWFPSTSVEDFESQLAHGLPP